MSSKLISPLYFLPLSDSDHTDPSIQNKLRITGVLAACRILINPGTVMCLSNGTPKNNKFSICSKWKIYYFRCPNIWACYSIIMGLNTRTPNNHYFRFGTYGKVVVLCVPILKHFTVYVQHVHSMCHIMEKGP